MKYFVHLRENIGNERDMRKNYFVNERVLSSEMSQNKIIDNTTLKIAKKAYSGWANCFVYPSKWQNAKGVTFAGLQTTENVTRVKREQRREITLDRDEWRKLIVWRAHPQPPG